MKTLLVDEFGDLALPDGANLQLIDGDAAVAQDIGQATKMLRGENQFDTSQGVDWFGVAFQGNPDYDQLRSQLIAAAESVPDVIEVESLEISVDGDELTFALQARSSTGTISTTTTVG